MPIQHQDYIDSKTVKGKFICTGSIFGSSSHKAGLRTNMFTHDIRVPNPEGVYLIYISITMISPYGGTFDEDDTISADIYSIDGRQVQLMHGFGGVWGGPHFRPKGDFYNHGINAFVGHVTKGIIFRLRVTGDNYAGASFIVMEL